MAIKVSGTTVIDDSRNIQNIGVITATGGIRGIGIQSAGINVATGIITALNFVGTGNTFSVNGSVVNISIAGGGGAGGFSTSLSGLSTTSNVGIGTSNLNIPNLVGAGNSLTGLYICNGMIVMDNTLSGNSYIGTSYNGFMPGPVTITGTLTINGNFVVV